MTEKQETAAMPHCALPGLGRWIGAMLLMLSACASVPEQSGAPLDKHEIVARIAESRWDALTKGDFETAYKLMSPASRTVVTLENFRRKVGMVTWERARIEKVECSADDLCAVQIKATYSYKPPRLGRRVENDQVLTETWRNTAGGWWYVPEDAL